MEQATWIMAICAILSIPISIWAIISARKNTKEIKQIKSSIFNSNSSKISNGNIVNVLNANNNGRDAVHFE